MKDFADILLEGFIIFSMLFLIIILGARVSELNNRVEILESYNSNNVCPECGQVINN